jgi:hypothetical protein
MLTQPDREYFFDLAVRKVLLWLNTKNMEKSLQNVLYGVQRFYPGKYSNEEITSYYDFLKDQE